MNKPELTIKLGTNPIAWSNDALPELGKDTHLATCLSEASRAGFSGIEMGGKFPQNPAELSAVLAQHKLQLISGWYSGLLANRSVEDEWQALQPHLKLLLSQDCKVLIYAETWAEIFCDVYHPMSQRPSLTPIEITQYAEKLTALATLCLSENIQLAVHHHLGSIIETESDIDQLMTATGPSVGLLLDTGHCLVAGIDPISIINRHGSRICHVHCKDVRPVVLAQALRADMGFMQAVLQGLYTVPGDGCIDYPAILASLYAQNYSGWLVVEAEQDPELANPFHYAKMGFESLEQSALAAGFQIDNS